MRLSIMMQYIISITTPVVVAVSMITSMKLLRLSPL